MHFGIKAGKGIESSGFLTIRSSSGPGEGNPRPPYSISNRITLLKSTVYIRLLTTIALKKKKKGFHCEQKFDNPCSRNTVSSDHITQKFVISSLQAIQM